MRLKKLYKMIEIESKRQKPLIILEIFWNDQQTNLATHMACSRIKIYERHDFSEEGGGAN